MNFDYTYIALGGFLVFEPMIIVTNSIFFFLCVLFYRRLSVFDHAYARQLRLFMLWLGISSLFGAVAHAVHYQLGPLFFRGVFFLMNACSLLSIYFCFRFTYTYANLSRPPRKRVLLAVMLWVSALLVMSLLNGNFALIKANAGIVLVYCLVIHARAVKRQKETGSLYIVYGIALSFLSILVHTLGLSFGAWFNQKDIAHVFMIASLIFIYKGARLNLLKMNLPVGGGLIG